MTRGKVGSTGIREYGSSWELLLNRGREVRKIEEGESDFWCFVFFWGVNE